MTDDSKVLVVDDEEDVADTYASAVSEEHPVTVAYSGQEALEAFDDEIDVVLLDRRMPEMSGDELLDVLAGNLSDCRVVMVTAVEPTVDIVEMSFDEYLVKPVQGDQLRAVVDRMLVRDELDDQIQQVFALASKLATLESKLSYDQLQQSEGYQQLRDEFDSLRTELDLPESSEDPYVDATIEKIQALLNERS